MLLHREKNSLFANYLEAKEHSRGKQIKCYSEGQGFETISFDK